MVELQQGDCLELMKKLPDASIDMILCDLPYGVTNCKWDVRIPLAPLWEQYKRVIKERGAIVLFGIEPFASELRMSNLKMYRYDWTWYKHYVRGFLNARKRPLRTTEHILVFAKKAPAYYPIMRKGVMRNKGGAGNTGGVYRDFKQTKARNDTYYPTDILDFKGCASNRQNHPTEKPVALLEYLIKTYTKEGDTVLDNCMGSGSTGVACISTGRNFIGYELDQNFKHIAEQRISDEITKQREGTHAISD